MTQRSTVNKGFHAGRGFIFAVALIFFFLAAARGAVAFTPRRVNVAPAAPSSEEPRIDRPEAVLAKGKFLVAGPKMLDPRFTHTVVIITDYGEDGAVGVIINRPTEVKLSQVLPDVDGFKDGVQTVYFGGPVDVGQMLLLVRADSEPEESRHVLGDLYVSISLRLLLRLAEDKGMRDRYRVYAGYAGWAPGQLEREVLTGAWQVISGDVEAVFDKDPSRTWPGLIR